MKARPSDTSAPRPRSQGAPRSLAEVADALDDERVSGVVAGFREYSRSARRSILLLLLLAWALYWTDGSLTAPPDKWATLPLDQVLPIEATLVMPYVIGFLVLSVAWTIGLRMRWIPETETTDAIGAVASFAGIWLLLGHAWNLTIASITFLPLASIAVGARFSRRWFYVSLVASLIIVGTAAPAGYWLKRPAFGIFAIVLLVGLPLTVHRVLSALWSISERAVHSARAQARFLATMSHELRTPLNTVVHAATLIDGSHFDQEDQRFLDLLETNANALLHRVNDVLDLAASEAGSLHIARDPFYVAQVFARLEKVVAHRAATKRIDLRFEGADLIPEALFGDSDRIEQVLTNLTTNAIKYTRPGGSVAVRVAARALPDPGNVTLTFEVADTGVGISDSDKQVVFQAFRKVGTQRGEGVGLGLHIAEAISRAMGCVFDPPRDNPGGGTVFTWHVPLQRCPPDTIVPAALSSLDALAIHRQRVAPMRCLVVEDQEANRAVFKRLLERAGHAAIFAENGYLGLQSLSLGGVDVVFLDLHMPSMSGMEVLEALLDADFDVPPIVILSAESDRAVVDKAMALGATAYLTKPLVTTKVLDILERLSIAAARAKRATPA